jgi:hypothetical protein
MDVHVLAKMHAEMRIYIRLWLIFAKPKQQLIYHALHPGRFGVPLLHGFISPELIVTQAEMTSKRDGSGAETIDAPETNQVRLRVHQCGFASPAAYIDRRDDVLL